MIELLAPAGDIEKLKFALLYGADAVYIGGQNFSLRANAKNFSLEDIKEAVEFAHSLNKRVYVTVNIVFHDEDLSGLEQYLKELSLIKVDAIIVSDFYVIKLIEDKKIPLEVHVSTQASTLNSAAAKFYQKHGVKRIVLAREASKENIQKIKEKTGLDLECFVHGAMCTSISGRCVLSNSLTNRDANRGGCAQICRWTFQSENKPVFSMTSKDLNMVAHIESMIDIGVNSFKVEGRMRGIYYIATVIISYRKMIDKVLNHTLTIEDQQHYLKVLNRVANRESKDQFYKNFPDETDQYFLGREEVSNQDFLGLVLDYDEEHKIALIEQRNYFKVGDIVEFFGPNLEVSEYQIQEIQDEKGTKIEVANHPNMIVRLPIGFKVQKYDMMRIKMFDK
ncbi:MAG: U32 family peptidase [Bacilli bacterium]|nr:U32 family peptidase [Bacilli bacterium]MBR1818036.1 U32 family peptidase [Bacilli bacterium]